MTQQPGVAVPESTDRLDIRLVPAALIGWAVTAAGVSRPIGGMLAVLCAAAAVAGAVLWWCGVRRRRSGWRLLGVVIATAAVLGAGFGWAVALRTAAISRHPLTTMFGDAATVTVTPSESAVAAGARRLLFRATVQQIGDHPTSGRVTVFATGGGFEDLMVGQPLTFDARIARPSRHDLTVATLTAVGNPVRGRAGPVARAAHRVRATFAAAAGQVLPAEQARLLPALVLGDTSAITTATGREFKAAGLTHLMAVSGANVTIVCGTVLFSAGLIGPRAAALLAAVALVAFVIVVQPSASVLRAAVMGAIALLGVLSARRRQAIPSLAGSVLVLLVLAPHLAVDVGFALSVAATAALVLIAPAWSARLVGRGWPKPLADAVCVAWAANLVTAPLIAGISGRLSLVSTVANLAVAATDSAKPTSTARCGASTSSTVANLAVAALIAPITVLGSAAAVLCPWWPTGARLLMRFTGPELWWVGRIAHWAGGLPVAAVPVPAGLLGVLGVSGAAVLVVLAWRFRWGRQVLGVGGLCLVAWSLAQMLTGWAGVGGA